MEGKWFETGAVTWRAFEALFELQNDFFRKARFFIKAGNTLGDETTGLEAISELLDRKESEFQRLRKQALSERDEAGGPEVEVSGKGRQIEKVHGPLFRKDLSILRKLVEISRIGGPEWENLKMIIEGTYAALHRNSKSEKDGQQEV